MTTISNPPVKREFTRENLCAFGIPEKTESYSPVPHKEVIYTVLESLDRAGLTILDEQYSYSKNGAQAIAHYRLNPGDSEMNLRLIWHNSYDKSMPLRIALGSHIIVCKNGMVAGDMGAFKRKHTGSVLEEFKQDIKANINAAGKTFHEMQQSRDRMKEIKITKKTTSELMGRLFIEESIINATQLSIIKREIMKPSFDYKVEDTLWNAYNHVTVALKEAHPSLYLKQHINLHNFLKKEYSI